MAEIYPEDRQLPSPKIAAASIAEDEEGHIVSVLFLQLAYHMEPLIISPEHRSTVNFRRLVRTLEQAVTSSLEEGQSVFYLVSAPKGSRIPKMAELVGMQSLNQELWGKTISANGGDQ